MGSGIKKLKRMMDASGLKAMGGPVPATEIEALSNKMFARIQEVVFAEQPLSPISAIVALDAVRRQVLELVERAELPAEELEKFRYSLQSFSDRAASLHGHLECMDDTSRKELDLGAVTVTVTAYKSKIPRAEDSFELGRRQVEALRQFADMWEKANEISKAGVAKEPENRA